MTVNRMFIRREQKEYLEEEFKDAFNSLDRITNILRGVSQSSPEVFLEKEKVSSAYDILLSAQRGINEKNRGF